LPAPELDAFAPQDIEFAAKAWTMRAEEEFRSLSVFAEITTALIDAALSLDLLDALEGVVQDELRHTQICTDMAHRLRGPPPAATLEPVRARTKAAAPTRRDQAESMLLVEGAVGETISAALFKAGACGTTEPCSRAALTFILKDESRHAAICWEALNIVKSEWTQATFDRLQGDVARCFGTLERCMIVPALKRIAAKEDVSPTRIALGVLPPVRRVESFYKSVEHSVLPRLAALGFDGDRAWEQRYIARAAR
jgi:hypothetical protein